MTKDTAIREQARAVFLAALMVLSVSVGTVALSGGAAAGTLGVSVAENDVGETTAYEAQFTVANSVSDSNTKSIVFGTDGADFSGVSASDVTVQIGGEVLTGSKEISVSTKDSTTDLVVELSNGVTVSGGDSVSVSVSSVVNPTAAGSPGATLDLYSGTDTSGAGFDSGTTTYSISDNTPAISEFSASIDDGTVNVSFVSNQSLDSSSIAVELNTDGGTVEKTLSSGYSEKSLDNGDFLYYSTWDAETDGATNGVYTATLTTATDSDSGNINAADGQTAEVTVDTKGPVFDTVNPADGANEKSVPDTIEVGVNDSLSEIESDSITVSLTNDGGYTFVDSVDVTRTGDGISFAYDDGDHTAGTLTIEPEELPISSFPDGDVRVDVTASDVAGNSNMTSGNYDTASGSHATYDFNLDTGANFEFAFSEDGDNDGQVLTNSKTQLITVTVDNDGLGTANLTIANSTDNWTFQNDGDGLDQSSGDVWDDSASPGEFVIEPGTTDGVPKLTDGTYTITVNATDTHGNVEPDETYTLEVDSNEPKFESVTVSGDGEDDVFNNREAESVVINATFNESVDTASVNIDVNGDGDFDDAVDEQDVALDVDADGTTASTVFDLSGTGVETDTASVNASSVTDVATNENSTPIASDSGGIDTDVPSVTNNLADATVLDSYINLTQTVDVSPPSDTDSVEYYIAEQDTNSYSKIDDPDHFDPSAYDDGVYKISVNVTDDADNVGSDVANNLVIDLEEPVVTTGLSNGERVSGEITLNNSVEVVNNDSSVELAYEIDKDGDGTFEENVNSDVTLNEGVSFDTSTYGGADAQMITVKVTATETGGAGESVSTTVDLVVDEVHVEGTTLEQNGEDLQVGVTTDEKVDELEVELNSTDSFHSQVSKTLTLEEFGEATETKSGNFQYVYNVSDVRDGAYSMNVSAAANGSHVAFEDLDAAYEKEDAELDNSDATVVDADVVGAYENSMTVQVEFSEPVSSIGSFDDFNGATVISHDVGANGIVNVTLNEEVQIDGTTELSANSVTEQYGDDSTESTSADVTFELQFSEGINVFSVPAETGSVSLEESPFNHDAVVGVFAYEGEGDWASYDPDAKENSLTELEGGNAYVVNATTGGEVDLNIQNVPSDKSQQAIQSQHVSEGWNLIGHYQEGSQSVKQALAPLDGRTYSVQKGYTGTQVDTLESGEGYWLFVEESGIHAPVDYSGMNTEQPLIHNFDVSNSGQDVTVSFTSDEALNEIVVDGTDAVDGKTLTEDDFSRTGSSGTYTYTATLSSGSDGTFGAVLTTAKDAAGNDGAAEEFDSVSVDTQVETTSLTATSSASQTIDVEVTSNEELSDLTVEISDSNGVVTTLSGVNGDFTQKSESGTYTYTASYSSATDGTEYTVTLISASDTNGNTATPGTSDTVTPTSA